MDIAEIIRATLQQALDEEGQRLVEQACRMEPLVVDDLRYVAFTEDGQWHVDLTNVIDSTAIVLDESIPALPAPKE
jgi:hypothetical protein